MFISKRSVSVLLLTMATAGLAMAAHTIPEIDGASAISVLSLLSGAVLVMRARRR